MPRIAHALILATGLGGRSLPLTETVPGPLVEVRGKALIDHTLDRLAAHGVERVVVSLLHHRARIEAHLRGRGAPAVTVRAVGDRIGGGAAALQALDLLGDAFFVIGGDVLWLDGAVPALDRLAAAWDAARMDALLLVHPTVAARDYDGPGEYLVDPMGVAQARTGFRIAPFLHTGIQVLGRALFADPPPPPFALQALRERAEANGRLHAIVHDGTWHRVREAEVREVETALAKASLWRRPFASP